MDNDQSILNKIIQSRQSQESYQLNPAESIEQILNHLSFKEREVITKRFSLDGKEKQTLEEIGKAHNITRERIRQIQSAAIRKIKTLTTVQQQLEGISHTVKKVLSDFGGIMEESHFLEELLHYTEKNEQNRLALLFIISQLLDEEVEKVKNSNLFIDGWKLGVASLELSKEIIELLHQLIEKEKRLLKLEELIERFTGHEYFAANKQRIETLLSTTLSQDKLDEDRIEKFILAHLHISKNIDRNILDEWGLKHWSEVKPKRMGDKVFLILKREGKPMHFTEITRAINDSKFDHKVAYPATIHNELILDDRFVLVGRGMYALKDWGYKNGTVSEVIMEVLKNSGRPLTKDEIVEQVLKARIVKKSTIYLALTNKHLFKKENNAYTVA